MKFGRLSVYSIEPRKTGKSPVASAICECGVRVSVALYDLNSGHTRSCGCLRKEVSKQKATTHGLSQSKEYSSWSRMLRRCYNSADPDYLTYGARGISVCDSWRQSFVAFYRDLGPAPSSKHSIDRIDNGGHYEPSNVRWALPQQQNRNKRNNIILTHNGVTLLAVEWAEKLGISPRILRQRLSRGWSVEDALTRPSTRSRKGVVHKKRRGRA